jgi:transcriptional regulator with XRE-family HTH domain
MTRAILTPTQCRNARAALGWSLRKLRAESLVSHGSISRFEHGAKLKDRTPHDLKRAFASAGLKFGPRGKIKKNAG